jgi:hypothetical protein
MSHSRIARVLSIFYPLHHIAANRHELVLSNAKVKPPFPTCVSGATGAILPNLRLRTGKPPFPTLGLALESVTKLIFDAARAMELGFCPHESTDNAASR